MNLVWQYYLPESKRWECFEDLNCILLNIFLKYFKREQKKEYRYV